MCTPTSGFPARATGTATVADASLLVVLPVLDADWARPCLTSVLAPNSAAGWDAEQTLVVDNTRDGIDIGGPWDAVPGFRDPDGHNLGVARSWNVGARRVLDEGLDYLVLCSASMQFGPVLHTTWVQQMERFWGENVIECDGHSWHLIAFHRRVFERVGLFDENFWPAYVEGLDYGYRMRMVGWEGGWRRCWVNAMSRGVAHHLQWIECPFRPLDAYYRRKWGGTKGEETNVLPFGDKPLDWFPETTIPELARRYGLGTRGESWW